MDAAEPRRARRGRESTAQTRTEGIRREKGCQQPCPASMTASAEAGWSGEEYDGLLGERKRGGGKVQGLLTERQGKTKGNERPRRRMNWVVRLAWVEEGRGGGGAALVVEGRPSKEARRRRSEGGWKGRGGWENDEGEGRGRKAARGPSEKDARRKPRQRLARGRFTARSPPRHCLDPAPVFPPRCFVLHFLHWHPTLPSFVFARGQQAASACPVSACTSRGQGWSIHQHPALRALPRFVTAPRKQESGRIVLSLLSSRWPRIISEKRVVTNLLLPVKALRSPATQQQHCMPIVSAHSADLTARSRLRARLTGIIQISQRQGRMGRPQRCPGQP